MATETDTAPRSTAAPDPGDRAEDGRTAGAWFGLVLLALAVLGGLFFVMLILGQLTR